jgi:hypothetical protein
MTDSRSQRLAIAAACALLLVVGYSGAAPAEGVRVARTIPYAEGSDAPQKVKDQCQLETKVPQFLAAYAGDVELVDGALGKKGRVLELTITDVRAPGGGAFSGPKALSVKGTLSENGKRIGNFVATRFSGGGAFGFTKGTCAIVGRCAKAIGKDIADWLKSPGKDSRLGDA